MKDYMINVGGESTIMLKAENYFFKEDGSLELTISGEVTATFAPNTWGHIIDYTEQLKLQQVEDSEIVELGVVH